MTTTHLQNTSEYKTFADELCGNSTNIRKYKEIFGETPVFNSVKPREKAGFKNWDNLDKLKTANEIGFLLSRHRNIGIRLGVQTDSGYTVVFDKESYGDIPDKLLERIHDLAVASWDSQSGGSNNLLTVTQEAYEYLDQFKTKVTFEGDKHDLELLTSGYALVPPSKIDEDHRYDSLKVDPQAPTLDIDSIRDILGDIPVSKKNEGDRYNQSEKTSRELEIDTLPSDFDHRQYFKDNIPGHNEETYLERLDTMLDNDAVAQLWYGDYEDRSKGELELRSFAAWYFNADTKMVQHIFENELPDWREEPLKYELNQSHAKDVITDIEDYINRPYYTTGISFDLWEQLAKQIHEKETVTVNELQDALLRTDTIEPYKENTIQKALQTFVQKDIINKKSNYEYENKRIDEDYLNKLKELIDEYEPNKLVYNNNV